MALPPSSFQKRIRTDLNPGPVSNSEFATISTADRPNAYGGYSSADTLTNSISTQSVGTAEENTKMGGAVSFAQQHQEILHKSSISSLSGAEADLDVDMDATQDDSSSYPIASQSEGSFAESFEEQQSTKLMMQSSALIKPMTIQDQHESQSMKNFTTEEMNLIGSQSSPAASYFPSPIPKASLNMDTSLAKDKPLTLSATSANLGKSSSAPWTN